MFSHAEVWHKSFEVVSTQELKVLAILNGGGGGMPNISTLKRGRVKGFTMS